MLLILLNFFTCSLVVVIWIPIGAIYSLLLEDMEISQQCIFQAKLLDLLNQLIDLSNLSKYLNLWLDPKRTENLFDQIVFSWQANSDKRKTYRNMTQTFSLISYQSCSDRIQN